MKLLKVIKNIQANNNHKINKEFKPKKQSNNQKIFYQSSQFWQTNIK